MNPSLQIPNGFTRPPRRVRYNSEYFGFIVGFPDGEVVLTGPTAMSVLDPQVTYAAIEPHLLTNLNVVDGFHLNTPPLVWLELTRKCDLACPHCYINGGAARQQEMPTHRWLNLLDEMADMGVWAVAFTGGEPTLYPGFAELVLHARERDLLVGIATHGLFLTDDLLTSLPKEGVIISVSIDDLHKGRAGRESTSEQAMAALLRARSHGFLTNIMTNTHRENIESIGRGKLRRDLENGPEHVKRAAEFWIRECEWEHQYHREAGLCVGVIFNYGLSLAYMTRRCSSGRFLCYVAADGTVFPCTMCASEEIFAAGSVKDHSFAEVWRDEWEIRQYSWANFADTCNGCFINGPRYYCASRCPAMSHARNGTYFGCGASEFEILSTIHRTSLLERTPTGKGEGLPVIPSLPQSSVVQ